MGRKVHPLGFRLGVIRDWQAKWYADKLYAQFLQEDLKLRNAIKSRYTDAGISQVQIERQANEVSIIVSTSRPGIVIGRGGQRVDEMRLYLEKLIGKRVRLNIQEIRQPEMDAFLVARNVADQMEHRVAYRRAMKQAIFRTIQAGAKGIRIKCGGRLAGAEIARRETMHEGRVPLNTLRADIDYGFAESHTTMGRIGVKVWIYKGEILPEAKEAEEEEKAAEVAVAAAPETVPVAVATETTAPVVAAAPAVPPPLAAAPPEAPSPAPVTPAIPAISEAEKPATAAVTEKKEEKAEKPAKPRVRRARTAPAAEVKTVKTRKTRKTSTESKKVAKEKEAKDVTTEAG